MRRLLHAVFVVVVMLAGLHDLLAQTPAADTKPLAFEVASVKVNRSGERGSRGGTAPGGRYTLTNVTVQQMLLGAFDLTESQIVDAPSWTREDRFDVVAKMPE